MGFPRAHEACGDSSGKAAQRPLPAQRAAGLSAPHLSLAKPTPPLCLGNGTKGCTGQGGAGAQLRNRWIEGLQEECSAPESRLATGLPPPRGSQWGQLPGQAAPAALTPARERLSSPGLERPEVLQFKYLKLYVKDDGLVLCIHPSGSCTAAHLAQGVTGTEKSYLLTFLKAVSFHSLFNITLLYTSDKQ